MKRIVHILPSSAPQAIAIANSLLSEYYSEFDNRCIIYGKGIIKSESQIMKLTKENNGRLFYCKSIVSFIKIIIKIGGRKVVCHGDSYTFRIIPLLLGCQVSWICWGAHTKLSGSMLSYLSYPLKYCVNNSLFKIVTLMLSDKEDLIKTFKVRRICVLPYPGVVNDKTRDSLEFFDRPYHSPLKVLIGNSGHCSPWYGEIIKLLSKFRDKIELHCMFQYPQMQQSMIEISKLGKEMIGVNFFLDTVFVEKEDYYKYISSYDIYICPKPSQSGLGAIHLALLFGKKIYLTGNNLEWEKYIGTKIFDIDSIKHEDFSEFSSFKREDKIFNRNRIKKHWDRLSDWKALYESL